MTRQIPILMISATLILSGCGVSFKESTFDTNKSSAQVLETSMRKVKNCQLLGIVENSSILGSGYGLAGLPEAKETAIDRARLLGATHIVWQDVVQDGKITASGTSFNEAILVSGAAYYCEAKPVDYAVSDVDKKDSFEYSEEQLKKKHRIKLLDDKKLEQEEVRTMPESMDGKGILEELPLAEFSPGEGGGGEPGKRIVIDGDVNPFSE